jgi:hypothetical protein
MLKYVEVTDINPDVLNKVVSEYMINLLCVINEIETGGIGLPYLILPPRKIRQVLWSLR